MQKTQRQVFFVEFDRVFLQKSFDWLSDSEIKRLTDTPDFTLDKQEQWFQSLSSKNDYYIRGILVDGIPIGAVGIKHITVVQGEYWGYIGEKRYWGQGIGKQMIEEMILVAKRIYNLEKMYLKVIVDNVHAIALYKRVGFITEHFDERFYFMTCQLNV